ncbi:hypothetical protein LZ32DRAFT_308531 [Colletotrichum eremochloae]|nr:hypothetical protein LZ32DRAFT_308531 [Colletotrichum eremochloae]
MSPVNPTTNRPRDLLADNGGPFDYRESLLPTCPPSIPRVSSLSLGFAIRRRSRHRIVSFLLNAVMFVVLILSCHVVSYPSLLSSSFDTQFF